MHSIRFIKLLIRLKLFNHFRQLYYFPERYNSRILKFYSQFIKKGDLCFDIGANIGRYTDIFLKLGAKVITVEPNPECAKLLRRKYNKNKNVVIIPSALSYVEGKETMFLCEVNSLSSMSGEWIERSKKSARAGSFHWNNKAVVPTTTLDQLCREYGHPQYCKIDVEGYEANVIKGMTKPIPYLSFEVALESYHHIGGCLQDLTSLGRIELNFSREDAFQFLFERWNAEDQINDWLASIKEKGLYGHIYVRIP